MNWLDLHFVTANENLSRSTTHLTRALSRIVFAAIAVTSFVVQAEAGDSAKSSPLTCEAIASGQTFLANQSSVTTNLEVSLQKRDADMQMAMAIATNGDKVHPEFMLAMLGDKKFEFSFDRRAFIMYSEIGGRLVAMGGPVGAEESWADAIQQFKHLARSSRKKVAFYGFGDDLLPTMKNAGFAVEKIGESAIVDLETFAPVRKLRDRLKSDQKKRARFGTTEFAVETLHRGSDLMKDLGMISDRWLAEKNAKEKSFSLGHFDEDFLDGTQVAVMRFNGRVVAFVTLWSTPKADQIELDLMRYDPTFQIDPTGQVKTSGLMDFILTESILWAKANGYKTFDLGMAPLSALDPNQKTLVAQGGRFIYEHGNRFYNFTGLRQFKDKFATHWEPRYIAANRGFDILAAGVDTMRLSGREPAP